MKPENGIEYKMYYPYFRGKQNELITIRDNAELLASSNIIPIIEPVKSNLNGLRRALSAMKDAKGRVIVIINPHHGDFANDGAALSSFIENEYSEDNTVKVGILLSKRVPCEEVKGLYSRHNNNDISFIHSGFSEGQGLAELLDDAISKINHIFIENYCGKLYRRHFKSDDRVLIRDGFIRRKNREYPSTEFFSDLHITYTEEGVEGFGDFLIVGDEYSESGGPAYAIAIHLTYIEPHNDNEMHIYHFISDRQNTPTDPAGKFAEALKKLIAELNRVGSNILETQAVLEFRDLHTRGHFPGLGYIKKLSMQHHIETLGKFLED